MPGARTPKKVSLLLPTNQLTLGLPEDTDKLMTVTDVTTGFVKRGSTLLLRAPEQVPSPHSSLHSPLMCETAEGPEDRHPSQSTCGPSLDMRGASYPSQTGVVTGAALD